MTADRPLSILPAKASPAFLEVGLRPFFLAGAAWAAIALGIWLAALAGAVAPGGDTYGPLIWHAHEMIYGFAAGIGGGFLLTAVPSWTGQPKLLGFGLAALVGVWLLGRIAMLMPDVVGVAVVASLDLGFLAVLTSRTAWQVRVARNWRNLPMVAGPAALLVGNAMVHADAAGLLDGGGTLGNRVGLAAMILLITLIGGRVIPAFTRNWLVGNGYGVPLPVEPGRFDAAVLLATVATFAAWLAWPEALVTGALAGLVAVGHMLRLARWRGWRTGVEPLVWVMHLGYLWVAIGFAFMAIHALAPDTVPQAAVQHAFGVGAIGTMTLAMMTRATLGHTGRALTADRGTAVIYLLVTAASVLRVTAALVPTVSTPMIDWSGVGWVLAFGLYLALYAPKLCGAAIRG
ncbi:NnrS family protein [Thalassobaculum sp.]|uniref:NnrS family protein n=1 Tax=Thalassobaculum sp. TaxID=2022740 RepID=UPI0032EA9795